MMVLAAEAAADPPRAIGIAVFVVLVALGVLLIGSVFSRTLRSRVLAPAGYAVVGIVGGYLVARGIVEVVTIDVADPASYRDDWGGPSLLGVLAVHCGPGVAVLIAAGLLIRRRRANRVPVAD
ncbi:hypothetical protein ACFWQG_06670 [Rhodococcus sp. NPDC058532]|uniref:hypothetical protein n=1 Tax=Rhodococcus sp. NPDC058532 TaxID=3346540 RepID=UPI00364AD6D8